MISFNSLKDGFELKYPSYSKQWLKSVIKSEGKSEGDIQFIFVDDVSLLEINKTHLNHHTLTDIITFGTSVSPLVISGDIYISIDRVQENASLNKQDFDIELSRVMVHGILHLIGYDDKTPEQKQQMGSKEDNYLNLQP